MGASIEKGTTPRAEAVSGLKVWECLQPSGVPYTIFRLCGFMQVLPHIAASYPGRGWLRPGMAISKLLCFS